jgi:hypothetical protein
MLREKEKKMDGLGINTCVLCKGKAEQCWMEVWVANTCVLCEGKAE